MHGSVTRLELRGEPGVAAAADALQRLLPEARQLDGFRDCYVLRTGPRELTMVTIYDSEAASRTASERLRPKLAASVGPHVVRPPERLAGEVVLTLTSRRKLRPDRAERPASG